MGLAASAETPSEGQLVDGSSIVHVVASPLSVAANNEAILPAPAANGSSFTEETGEIGTPTFQAPRIVEEPPSQVEAIGTITPPALGGETEGASASLASTLDERLKQGSQPNVGVSGNKANFTGVKSPEAILNASLQKQTETLRQQVQTLIDQIKAEKKQGEKAVLDATIDVQNQINQLRTLLGTKDEEIVSKKQNIQNLAAEIEGLKEKIERLKQELAQADAYMSVNTNAAFTKIGYAENNNGGLETVVTEISPQVIAKLFYHLEGMNGAVLKYAKDKVNLGFEDLVVGKIALISAAQPAHEDSSREETASEADTISATREKAEGVSSVTDTPSAKVSRGAPTVITATNTALQPEEASADLAEHVAQTAVTETVENGSVGTTPQMEGGSEGGVQPSTAPLNEQNPVPAAVGGEVSQAEPQVAIATEQVGALPQNAEKGLADHQTFPDEIQGEAAKVLEKAKTSLITLEKTREILTHIGAGGTTQQEVGEDLGSPFRIMNASKIDMEKIKTVAGKQFILGLLTHQLPDTITETV